MDFPLAAIRFEAHGNIDGLLAQVATTLTARGMSVAGVLQHRGAIRGDCHCADMDLVSIATGAVFRISQPLGNGARGCRLDAGALAHCSAAIQGELAREPDLLILNRFGKGESEGRGFRDLMSQALLAGVPVLTAVRSTYAEDWATFGGGMAMDLRPDISAVLRWFDTASHRVPATAVA